MTDNIRQALLDTQAIAAQVRDERGTGIWGLKRMAKAMDDCPPWFPADRHTDALGDGYDVRAMAHELANSCPELDGDIDRVAFAWWTGAKASAGRVVLGKACKLSPKERALMAYRFEDAPWWRVELSLAYWMMADDMERYRLLHHELMHLTVEEVGEDIRPAIRSHDVEDFSATVGRFGLLRGPESIFLANATQHPRDTQNGKEQLFLPWEGPRPGLSVVSG